MRTAHPHHSSEKRARVADASGPAAAAAAPRVRIGGFDAERAPDGRVHCGMLGGAKAPSFRAGGRFVKLFRTAAGAQFAADCAGALRALGLPSAAPAEVATLRVTAAELHTVADTPVQALAWARHYAGDVAALVAPAVGATHDALRKIAAADLAAPGVLEQLTRVLVFRRALRVSDTCTSNVRVLGGAVYSIDHGPAAAPEFLPARFPRAMREACRGELRRRPAVYAEFLEDVRREVPWADPDFRLPVQ